MTSSRPGDLLPIARPLFAQAVGDLRNLLDQLGPPHLEAVAALAADILRAWSAGGKLLICGNGGSAADSQHIAAELVGRFLAERPGYPALALTVNSSILTAVANDYGFEEIFARQVQALGTAQDVLLVMSTSGNSPNCLRAVEAARAHRMRVHAFLGGTGGRLLPLVDGALVVPSTAGASSVPLFV